MKSRRLMGGAVHDLNKGSQSAIFDRDQSNTARDGKSFKT